MSKMYIGTLGSNVIFQAVNPRNQNKYSLDILKLSDFYLFRGEFFFSMKFASRAK